MAEVVGLVSGIASLVALAVKITGLSCSYIADTRSAHSTQKQYLREVNLLTEVLLRIEEVSQNLEKDNIAFNRPNDLFKTVLAECAEKLEKLCSELQKPKPSVFWPIHERTLKKHVEDLHRFRGIFDNFLSTQSLTIATATHRNVARLASHQDQTDLLEWLGNPKETSKPVPSPLVDTGTWFLNSEAYRQWADGSRPSLLWCHGPPGVGKSMLAAVAIQDLSARSASIGVLHYFFDFGNRKEQTKETIWKALLRQVIRKRRASTVQKLVNFRKESGFHRPAIPRDISDALKIACADQEFVLVLDAPDEMENSKELKTILVPFTNASVLVTSRDTPEIRSTLDQATKMELQADSNDMRAYVASRFEECDLDDVIERHPELESEILEKSQGIFLLVRLLADQLVDLSTVKEMRKALQVYPTHLDEAFESSLQRINAQPGPRSKVKLAHRVMGWIVSAERKLRMSELVHGLAIEEGIDVTDEENLMSSKTILKLCGGLVVLQGTAVSMVHTTVHTWLRSRYDGSYHKDLVETCLRYLTMSSFSSGVAKTLDEMDKRLSTFPFFSYAAQNWRRHLSRTEDVVDSKSIDRLLDDSGLRSAAFQGANYNNNFKSPRVRGAMFEAMPHGRSALHFASYWNLPAKVEKLLLRGEEKNATNAQMWTPLHWACFAQSHEAVEVLLSHGVNTNARDSGGWTPLFWAALNGDTTTVQALLRHGASHTERDNHDWTAVRWAVASLHTDVVKMLLEHHTNTASSSYNRPSLRNLTFTDARAFIASNSRVIKRDLIDEWEGTLTKSDTITNEYDGLLAIFQEKTFDIKRLWRSRRFDPPVWNAWRSTRTESGMFGPDYYIDSYTQELSWKSRMLQSAIRDGKLLAVRLLIEAGAEVNHAAEQTPLHAATFKKDISFAEILIKHGAHIEARNHYNLTPLQQAVSNGFEEVTRLLLSNGANVNVSCNEPPVRGYDSFLEAHWTASKTPLMLACGMSKFDMDGSAHMVKMLLEHGADPNIEHKMDEGKTAFCYAIEVRSPKILKLLFDANVNSGGFDQAQRTQLYDVLLRRDWERPEFDSKRNCIQGPRTECLNLLVQTFGHDFFNQKADWTSCSGSKF
ncbi:Ankyrin repeat and KH domain-containing protein 1 [Colletotrichum tropicale]|nr:Ankyrin repeat and KH domain-containing protein 1 [Colletotrichum tropicale]